MIDFLFFLIIPLCVPAGDSYDCSWQIYLLDTHEQFGQAEGIDYTKILSHWQENDVDGVTDMTMKNIYILKYRISFYQSIGCTTLWHEIQHAWGYMEERIPLCKYSYGDHVKTFKRLNFYPNPDLPLPDVPDRED